MTHTSTQQPEALNLEEFRAKVTRAAREPLLARIAELEKYESNLIVQRDHCEEIIDRMADAVLGEDRPEWSSAYDFMDAAQDVDDRIAELEAQLAAAQGLDVQLVAFIEKVRDFKAQAVRVGSKEGEIRWDIEFGHYDAEVRGKTLQEAITKALAAQAKLSVK